MIQDAQNEFSNAQAVTASAVSTNVLDLKNLRDLGTGENLFLVVVVTTLMASAGDTNTGVRVDIETDDAAGMDDPIVAQQAMTIPAKSPAGTLIAARLQPGVIDQEFLQLRYNALTANLTAGAFTARLTKDIQKIAFYPSGFSVL